MSELLTAMADANRTRVENARLRAENERLREALQWIHDACGDHNSCLCGRPTGVGALKAHALAALGRRNEMQDFQQRVVTEKAELDDKREKLGTFKNTDAFAGLPWQEQERLNTQAHIMTMYSGVLGARITAFAAPAPPEDER